MAVLNPQQMHRSRTFPETVKYVYKDLQQQLESSKPEEGKYIRQDSLQLFCVWNGLETKLSSRELRKSLERLLGLQNFTMIQIVGDSNRAFSVTGLEQSKRIILDSIEAGCCDTSTVVLEYGYTACIHDTNWIVNEIIASMPQLSLHTIANIVYMSSTAVEEWGCKATSLVRNFVLAYDTEKTAFGSDTWLSDSVMNASYGDKLICLEGGPQAFAQSVNVCLSGVSITAVTGSQMRAKPDQSTLSEFSAADALRMLQIEVCKSPDPQQLTPKDIARVEAFFVEYLDNLPDFKQGASHEKRDRILRSTKALLKRPGCMRNVTIERVDHI